MGVQCTTVLMTSNVPLCSLLPMLSLNLSVIADMLIVFLTGFRDSFTNPKRVRDTINMHTMKNKICDIVLHCVPNHIFNNFFYFFYIFSALIIINNFFLESCYCSFWVKIIEPNRSISIKHLSYASAKRARFTLHLRFHWIKKLGHVWCCLKLINWLLIFY